MAVYFSFLLAPEFLAVAAFLRWREESIFQFLEPQTWVIACHLLNSLSWAFLSLLQEQSGGSCVI